MVPGRRDRIGSADDVANRMHRAPDPRAASRATVDDVVVRNDERSRSTGQELLLQRLVAEQCPGVSHDSKYTLANPCQASESEQRAVSNQCSQCWLGLADGCSLTGRLQCA